MVKRRVYAVTVECRNVVLDKKENYVGGFASRRSESIIGTTLLVNVVLSRFRPSVRA